MKIQLLLVAASISMTFTAQAQTANVRAVASRSCDGVVQKPLAGERIAVVGSYLGHGYTDDNGCNTMTFHTVFTSISGEHKGVNFSIMQVVQETALQKSSCAQDIEIPVEFSNAEIQGNKITLTGGTKCKALELTLK